MSDESYKPISDGWYNSVKPCYVEVKEDYFNENSLVVSLSFDVEKGAERPNARLPLVYASDHKISVWKDGVREERKATAADQRDAYSFLANLFPEWVEYCKAPHTTEEKLNWFENEGSDVVKGTEMDIKVWHSQSGFPNATVKDPTHVKPKKERVTKSAAIQRAADTMNQFFGSASSPDAIKSVDDSKSKGADLPKESDDDSDIPF